MPIVHMGYHNETDFRDGARSPVEWKDGAPVKPFYYLYETHHGLCLFEREENGYHDSDFYMTVFNMQKREPERILFASTRGWSYPCYASAPDATDEVRAAYDQWLKERDARIRRDYIAGQAKSLMKLRRDAIGYGERCGFPHWRLTKLRHAMDDKDYARVVGLFNPRLRNTFKISIREHVVKWLQQDAPKYPTPLSRKQMQYI